MMARKQRNTQPPIIPFRRQAHQRCPAQPPSAQQAPSSAAERLATIMSLHERTALVGRLDPFHAHRGGYWQGAMDALSALEQLLDLDAGTDLETALEGLRAWLLGDVFGQWVNAPDDPQDILPGDWLARRNAPSPSSPAS